MSSSFQLKTICCTNFERRTEKLELKLVFYPPYSSYLISSDFWISNVIRSRRLKDEDNLKNCLLEFFYSKPKNLITTIVNDLDVGESSYLPIRNILFINNTWIFKFKKDFSLKPLSNELI